MKTGTKNLVTAALLVSLSFVGANIKLMGTIAFDSLPAFLGALILGPWWGAAIGATGHMLTALTSGFPLSIPVHLAVAVTMALTITVFYLVKRFCVKNLHLNLALIIAVVAGALMNGPVALMIMSPLLLPAMGWAGIYAMMLPLTMAGAANAALAALLYRVLPQSITRKKD